MKKLLLFLLLVGAGLVGIAVWINYPRTRSVTEKLFSYAHVEKGTMMESVSATGVVQVEPSKMVVVCSDMPGTVVAVLGKVNDQVSEGAVLLTLDDRRIRLKWEEAQSGLESAQAGEAQAQAGLEQAQAHLQAAQIALKYQIEIEGKGGFKAERDQAEVRVKEAQAGVNAAKAGLTLAKSKVQAAQVAGREAKLALDLTEVRVPGTSRPALACNDQQPVDPALQYLILECKVQRGQQVGPQPLFILARDLRRLDVHAQVAEGDIGKVKKGLLATFTVTAFSDENIEFAGKVKEIRPLPSNVKGAVFYDTVITVDNQKDEETGEWRLRPGMTAAVDIIRRKHKDVWKMPTAALNFQMEDAYQSDAARERVAEWQDKKNWKPVWIWDTEKGKPWPIFVRIGGLDKAGEPGLKDSGFNEVLEWEPGQEPTGPPPRVIISAPPAHAPGFFDKPANIKVSERKIRNPNFEIRNKFEARNSNQSISDFEVS
jgi:HlyD family secretion protein